MTIKTLLLLHSVTYSKQEDMTHLYNSLISVYKPPSACTKVCFRLALCFHVGLYFLVCIHAVGLEVSVHVQGKCGSVHD